MAKVSQIDQRKFDHIKINLENDVQSTLFNGLENIHFIHEALPELDLNSIDLSLSLFGKKLNAPIQISSMTGGTKHAKLINRRLAQAAAEMGLAMGVGSQRAAIENPDLIDTYSITRKVAPDILLFANLGAVQLNYGYDVNNCLRAVDMLAADALILHLNPLQEALQVEGNVDFSGLAAKIEKVCRQLPVPVIVKEVGWGISKRTAKLLANCGVAAIDVAGAGGTSWSQVEMYRAPDEYTRNLAATFESWGIPTVESILNVKQAAPGVMIFASGGLKNGLDIAKSLLLGASLGGMANQALKPAAVSAKKLREMLLLIIQQIKVTMFTSGLINLQALHNAKYY